MEKSATTLTPKEDLQEIQKIKASLRFHDRQSVLTYGVEAQEKLDTIATQMIEGVKNKDLDKAGESLNQMVLALRGFRVDDLRPEKVPWWKRLLGMASGAAEALQRYEEVRDQIDLLANALEKHKAKLMQDVISLEKLYEANLEYFKKLALYIQAGEEVLQELDEKIIPRYRSQAQHEDMVKVQEFKEIQDFRDELERRIHDLKLSRQVAMQALPSIRLIQDNDKALINKITSTLVNTLPLWRNQLAQTVTILRSKEAAHSLKEAADLTNELLEKNAQVLKETNKEVKTQVERGVFDIESIKRANQTLIETLNDSLQIAKEGHEARKRAQEELQKAESELKKALLEVKKELS